MTRGKKHILAPGLVFAAMAGGTIPIIGLSEFLTANFGIAARETGTFISAGLIAGFIFAPIAGWVSDRLPSRRIAIGGGALVNALCWLLISMAPNFQTAQGLRVLEGVSSAFVIGPLLALSGEAERERRGAAGSVLGPTGMLLLLGVAAGILLGGILSSKAGPLVPFFASTGILLLVAVLVLPAGETGTAPATKPTSGNRDMDRGTVILLTALLILAFADRFAAGFLMGGFLIHLKSDMGHSAAQAGALLSLVSFPMALGAVPAVLLGRRLGLPLIVGIGSAIFGVLLPIMTLAQSGPPLIVLLGLAGLSAALMYAPCLVLLEHSAPSGLRGMFLGLFYGVGSMGYALGPAASTKIVEWLNGSGAGITELPAITVTAGVFGLCELIPGLVLLGLIIGGRLKPRAVASSIRPEAAG